MTTKKTDTAEFTQAMDELMLDIGFDASIYGDSRKALSECVKQESEAWAEWRDTGKVNMAPVRDVLNDWELKALAIHDTFHRTLSPKRAIYFMECLMSFPNPLPPALDEQVEAFRKPTSIGRNGKEYGPRQFNSISHYSSALIQFNLHKDIVAQASVLYE